MRGHVSYVTWDKPLGNVQRIRKPFRVVQWDFATGTRYILRAMGVDY